MLVYYAALPLVLTPELLNYLRNKFLQDQVPWVAEADILLSDLCRPVGSEQYVMNTEVRAYLVGEAQVKLGEERMREIAHLLIHYINKIYRAGRFISKHELQSQQWAAMVYLAEHRETVVREIAETFKDNINPINSATDAAGSPHIDYSELGRLVKLTDALTPELKSYPELIRYAECVGRVLSSIRTRNLRDDASLHKATRVLDVKLPAPGILIQDQPEIASDFDFGAMLDQYEQEQAQYQEGSVVRGTVVGVTERSVVIDFGFKSEGAVPIEEFMEAGELTVKRGDEVEVLIKSMESSEGVPILSRADVTRLRAWDDLEQAYREGTPVKGRIIERVKGGLRVDVDGVAAFLPGSQVDVRPIRNLESLRGQEIEAKVIKLNRKRSNVVLSRKAILEEENEGKKGETLDNLEEGIIVEGQIKNLADYGAFVDLGGIDGLLHVTDMSWGRLLNPGEMFRVGEMVQVKVLKFDKDRERVSLGYKQLLPDPWESVAERFPTGQRMSGKIASVTDYGAFIELEPGVEGLVHVSDISWNKRIKHPGEVLKKGQEIEAVITNIDIDNRRLSLSIKDTEPSVWEKFINEHKPGDIVRGRVTRFANFGAFVELAEGLEGLCYVSELSDDRVERPEDAAQIGQELDFRILRIEPESKKIGLSHRAAKHDEPIVDVKSYTTDAGGDMASLGELADFFNRRSGGGGSEGEGNN